MRFGPRNRMFFTTDTTGLGHYLIGPAFLQHQDLSTLPDGTVVPYRIAYGADWECGFGTKNGQLLERTVVIESTNGNAKVNWGEGVKPIAIDRLASMVVVCRDGSILIEDDINTGETVLRGLKIGDVFSSLADAFTVGVDLKLTLNDPDNPTSFRFDVLRKVFEFTDASDEIELDFAYDVGSTQLIAVTSDTIFTFANAQVGQEVLVELRYDPFGYHKITWPSTLKWASRTTPATTPIGGKADAFRIQRLTDENIGTEEIPVIRARYLGWPVSVERPVIVELEASPNVEATLVVDPQGSAGGPNEIQYLTALVNSDYMEFTLNRTGNVTNGTFDLTIQENFSNPDNDTNHVVVNIPYDVTGSELLELIWAQTPLTPFIINLNSGTNGALCSSQLNTGVSEIGLEFLGKYRYYGYVISIDSQNLVGGTYGVEAVGSGSGGSPWIFNPNQCYVPPSGEAPSVSANFGRLTFNGQTTTQISASPDMATSVREALEALSNIGEGNILVTFDRYGTFIFEFINELGSQNIDGEIQWHPDYLPQNLDEEIAFGQLYGTSRNGAGPASTNEVHTLTVTGNPIVGEVILTVMGNAVHIPVYYTANQIAALLRGLNGFHVNATENAEAYDNFSVSGGPLPGQPIVITFLRDFGGQNVTDSTVETYSAGAAFIDHAECDEARIYMSIGFQNGSGTYTIAHKNPMPGKTIHTQLINEGTEFEITLENLVHFYPDLINPAETIPGRNQIDRLTATDPLAEGRVVLRVARTYGNLGKRVIFETGATNAEIKTLIEKQIGDGVSITGGPFPSQPIEFEWIGQFSHQARAIMVPLFPPPADNGSMDTINEVLYPAIGTIAWIIDSENGTLDWGGADSPGMPTAWIDTYQVFHDPRNDPDRQKIIAKDWFHSGEGGGGNPGPVEVNVLPGYNIEIDQTTDPETDIVTSEIHNYWTTEIVADAPTVMIDLDPEKGGDKVVTIFGNRNIDCVNEIEGKEWKLQVIQGSPGNFSINFLFEVEWVEFSGTDVQPAQTPVPTRSDEWHFLCVRERGQYVLPKFKAWVETTERPQPLVDTSGPTAANEVQQIHITPIPTGGTWIVGFMGAFSNPMAFNANATSIRLTLQTMPTIGTGNILVSGGRLGVVPIRLEFVNALGGQNLPQVTVQTDGLQF